MQPIARNPTPLKTAFQPALRADVSRAGEATRPRRFNLHHFRPHGSPSIVRKNRAAITADILFAKCTAQRLHNRLLDLQGVPFPVLPRKADTERHGGPRAEVSFSGYAAK